MQLIHRVGEHYLNFNSLFKIMLNCYCFKGSSGHLGTHLQTVELQSGSQNPIELI